jgi:glucose-1-phosphate thymidylyltransferase
MGTQSADRNLRRKDIVGLIPAAGQANRIAPLPCSKELFPVGFHKIQGVNGLRPKVVSHYLLENMRLAGIKKAYIVLRQGKWDIPSYWGDGRMLRMGLGYLVIEGSAGPPDTIDRAYEFVKDKVVAFGFPDIVFKPRNVFSKLIRRLYSHGADVVLALFPAHDTKAMDLIKIDPSGRIAEIHLKPKKTRLKYAWLCAVWTPTFTDFLHQFSKGMRHGHNEALIGNGIIDPQGDVPVGAILRAAVKTNLKVEGSCFHPDVILISVRRKPSLCFPKIAYVYEAI